MSVKKKISNDETMSYREPLVAKGFVQKYGVDYEDTFSLVVKHSTLRLLIAMATKLDLDHLDICAAFLIGFLEKPVHMRQPEGFSSPESSSKVL